MERYISPDECEFNFILRINSWRQQVAVARKCDFPPEPVWPPPEYEPIDPDTLAMLYLVRACYSGWWIRRNAAEFCIRRYSHPQAESERWLVDVYREQVAEAERALECVGVGLRTLEEHVEKSWSDAKLSNIAEWERWIKKSFPGASYDGRPVY